MINSAANKILEMVIFRNCFVTSYLLISIFSFFSFILCALPFETNKFRGTNLEIAVQSDDYKWWLLITFIVSVPSIIIRFLDLFRPWPTLDEERLAHRHVLISRSLEILVIAVPNFFLYLIISSNSNADFAIVANLQNALIHSQTVAVSGSIFCSTFGHKYKNMEEIQLDISIEKSTVAALIFLVVYKIFTFLGAFNLGNNATVACRIMAAIFVLIAAVIAFITVLKFTHYLCQQLIGFTFSDSNQMHDFCRMVGVVGFCSYNFVFYALNGQLTSSEAPYNQNSSCLVNFLIGNVLLIVYLTVIDQHCALFDVTLKREQLQMRLNLVRYISHELRSPLNSSFLGLQMLRGNVDIIFDIIKTIRDHVIKNKSSDPGRIILKNIARIADEKEGLNETIELVKESSNIALETLNDMLTFDKIDEKKLKLEVEDTDVWKFVSDTVRPFRINAMKEQLSLTTECTDLESNWLQRFVIKADKFKLNQVLRNFISNALKFSPKKTGTVHVLVERVAVPSRVVNPFGSETCSHLINDIVRVSVTDNGFGISLENQKALFGQYVQFNASAHQKGGGSGLGLWISKHLVEMHGGVIGVHSDGEGCGTTFFFELPLFEKAAMSDGNDSPLSTAAEKKRDDVPLLSGDHSGLSPSSPAIQHTLRLSLASAISASQVIPNTMLTMGGDDDVPAATNFAISRLYRTLSSRLSFSSVQKHCIGAIADNSKGGDEESGLIHIGEMLTATNNGDASLDITIRQSFSSVLQDRIGGVGSELLDSDSVVTRPMRRLSMLEGQLDKVEEFVERERESYNSSLSGNGKTSDSPRALRILIVDDTASTRKITARMLGKLGYEVEEASDGLEFLQRLGIHKVQRKPDGARGSPRADGGTAMWTGSVIATFDVILMDDNMPNMCGPDATATARAAGYTGLIFGVTGNTYDAQLEHFAVRGADKVFTKPLDIQKLQGAIRSKFQRG